MDVGVDKACMGRNGAGGMDVCKIDEGGTFSLCICVKFGNDARPAASVSS